MNRVLKLGSGILGLLLLVSGLFFLYIFISVSEADLKNWLASYVKRHSEYQLQIEGELQWSLLPSVSLTASDVSLLLPDTDEKQFSFAHLSLTAELQSLLSRSPSVDTVTIDGLKLFVTRDKQGRLYLLNKKSSRKSSQTDLSLSIPFQQVLLTNFELEVNDFSTGRQLQLLPLEVRLSRKDSNALQAVLLSEPLQLDMLSTITMEDGDFSADINLRSLNPNPLLTAAAIKHPFNDSFVINGRLLITKRNENTTLLLDRVVFNDSLLQGKILLDQPGKKLDARLRLDKLRLDPLLTLLPIQPDSNEPPAILPDMNLEVEIDRLFFEDGEIQSIKNSLTLSEQDLKISGSMNFSRFDLLSLLHQLPFELPMENDQVFRSINGELVYHYDQKKLDIPSINLLIDETHIKGDFSYVFDNPEVDINLFLDQIKLDDYLPESEKNAGENPGSGFPIAWLKQLKGQGKIDVGRLDYNGDQFESVSLSFSDE